MSNHKAYTFPSMEDLAGTLTRLAGDHTLPEFERIQMLLGVLIKEYVNRRCHVEQSSSVPYLSSCDLTATEVAVLATDLLQAVDMDTFELHIWRSLGHC